MIDRRTLLLGASLAPLASSAQAQTNWPQQVVRIVVPFVPGAFTDVSARLLWSGLIWALAIGFIGGLFPAVRAARQPITVGLREL